MSTNPHGAAALVGEVNPVRETSGSGSRHLDLPRTVERPEELETGEEEDLCGDCSPFVMVCRRGFDELAERHELTADERWALLYLAALVDYRTGEVAETTRDAIAKHLGWHRNKAGRVLARLAACGLVASYFPRGHRGWLVVLAYLKFVRVKNPAAARAIAKNLDRRRTEAAEHNAPDVQSEPLREGAPQRAHGALLRPERAERAEAPQRAQCAERPGETAGPAPSELVQTPSAFDSGRGGRIPNSLPLAVGEVADLPRARLCLALAAGVTGAPATVPVAVRGGPRGRRSPSVRNRPKSASPQVMGEEPPIVADVHRVASGRCGFCGRDRSDLDAAGWCGPCRRGRARARAAVGVSEHEGFDDVDRVERNPDDDAPALT